MLILSVESCGRQKTSRCSLTDVDLVGGVVTQTEDDESEHGEQHAGQDEHEGEEGDAAAQRERVDELHERLRTALIVVQAPVQHDALQRQAARSNRIDSSFR